MTDKVAMVTVKTKDGSISVPVSTRWSFSLGVYHIEYYRQKWILLENVKKDPWGVDIAGKLSYIWDEERDF